VGNPVIHFRNNPLRLSLYQLPAVLGTPYGESAVSPNAINALGRDSVLPTILGTLDIFYAFFVSLVCRRFHQIKIAFFRHSHLFVVGAA